MSIAVLHWISNIFYWCWNISISRMNDNLVQMISMCYLAWHVLQTCFFCFEITLLYDIMFGNIFHCWPHLTDTKQRYKAAIVVYCSNYSSINTRWRKKSRHNRNMTQQKECRTAQKWVLQRLDLISTFILH